MRSGREDRSENDSASKRAFAVIIALFDSDKTVRGIKSNKIWQRGFPSPCLSALIGSKRETFTTKWFRFGSKRSLHPGSLPLLHENRVCLVERGWRAVFPAGWVFD